MPEDGFLSDADPGAWATRNRRPQQQGRVTQRHSICSATWCDCPFLDRNGSSRRVVSMEGLVSCERPDGTPGASSADSLQGAPHYPRSQRLRPWILRGRRRWALTGSETFAATGQQPARPGWERRGSSGPASAGFCLGVGEQVCYRRRHEENWRSRILARRAERGTLVLAWQRARAMPIRAPTWRPRFHTSAAVGRMAW